VNNFSHFDAELFREVQTIIFFAANAEIRNQKEQEEQLI